MSINLHSGNRTSLSPHEKDFLSKIVPLSMKMQEWTLLKSEFLGIQCPRGVLASITVADIILTSNWGLHPISQSEIGNKYSNNLLLLEAGEYWKGRFNVHEDKKYRAYKLWEDFATDASDWFVFSGIYTIPLLCSKLKDQIQALSYTKPNYKEWGESINYTINLLNLTEFDL